MFHIEDGILKRYNKDSKEERVIIPHGVKEISDCAFEGCVFVKSIEIPDSVTIIGRSAFERCYSLQSIKIPDSVQTMGGGLFFGCTALESFIRLPRKLIFCFTKV